MDVLFALVALVAAGHQLLADGRVYVQVDDQIRGGNAQQGILKMEKPLQKGVPLLLRKLAALVDGVGGGVPIRHQNAPLGIEASPILLKGGEPVHREEGGGGVGIHIPGVLAELPPQVHFDQGGGIGRIVGEGNLPHLLSPGCQILHQLPRLGALAAAVQALNNNQFSHCYRFLLNVFFIIPQQFPDGKQNPHSRYLGIAWHLPFCFL